MLKYVLLVVGFLLLIKGADLFVDGSSSVAKLLKIPSVIIGLTIVSIGTSMPEAAVSISAGFSGNSDIAIGNVIGSNVFNLLGVIGLSAIFLPIITEKEILKRDIPVNILITILLFLFMWNGKINRIEGAILLVGMIIYMIILVRNALKNRTPDADGEENNSMSVGKSIIFIVIGLAAIIFGGNMVVDNASKIATSLGMSETLVGLTIVAVGTSLPELTTSVVASRKGDSGIALGNAAGSCIFNILFILGTASLLTPVNVANELIIDCAILIVVSVIIWILAKSNEEFSKAEGLLCVVLYILYTAYIIIR